MNRIFSSILMLALSLAAVSSAAVPALADSRDETRPSVSFPAALMIKAPNRVGIGQSISIAVLDKHGHDKISGASVYSIKADDLVIKPGSENYTTLIAEYTALIESKGTLIGATTDNGTIDYQFTEAGRFVLVATKDSFMPGFSRLTVESALKTALSITSPSSATLNETVTFTVTAKDNGQAVAGAAVYARLFEGNSFAGSFDKETGSDNLSACIPGIKESGTLLGNTDSAGQVAYAFLTAGRYFLTAVSDNYSPAYSMISVAISDQDNKQDHNTQQLTITAPQTSPAGQQVTITVSDNTTPVSGAAVYILNIQGAGVKKSMPTISDSQKNHTDLFGGKENRTGIWESGKNVQQNKGIKQGEGRSARGTDNDTDQQGPWSNSDDGGKGTLAGNTDSNGQVVYTFSSAGQYDIAVYKNGYRTGFAKITITQ